MSDRIITVVLKVKDEKAARAIWDAHLSGELLNGCFVGTIANGDVCMELEKLESEGGG